MWSQMHGNETTTTKAMLHFFEELIKDDSYKTLGEKMSILAIPILNPDGAERYTRENAVEVDLNRDAQDLTQPESVILSQAYKEFKPDLCLNLHGQRSIYGLTGSENPAIVSFLAPAADAERSITPARLVAMHYINDMVAALSEEIGNTIGRYDDSFNLNCVGDTFTALKTPTILFEAGQFGLDYKRNNTTKLLVTALKTLVNTIVTAEELPEKEQIVSTYLNIPENAVNYNDILIKGVLPGRKGNDADVAIQYEEQLVGAEIRFEPIVEHLSKPLRTFAHRLVKDEQLKLQLSGLEEDNWPDFIEDYVLKNFRL